MTNDKTTYTVIEKRMEAPNVATLILALADGTIPPFVSGQFITVYFPELGTPEGKAYSISSAPEEKTLAITVKAIGEFSRKLVGLEPGAEISASLPYGFFYSDDDRAPMVCLAAGIGITPIRSMIISALEKDPYRVIRLLHTNTAVEHIVFRAHHSALALAHDTFSVSHFITRETPPEEYIQGRIGSAHLAAYAHEFPNAEFFVCGPIGFTGDMWKLLRKLGIPDERIYTEAFFSH